MIALALTLTLSTVKPGLMVLDPDAKGASPVEVAVVATAVANGARDLDTFEVMTANDVRTMLGVERQRQLMGNATESANLAESMGARYVISSTATKAGAGLEVDLRLLDTASGKVLSQKKSDPLAKPADVSPAVQGLTQELLGVLLANEQGSVLVRASEEGAEVRVDGKLLGSTPMSAPLNLARGRHRLEVAKDGFITTFRPIEIRHNQTSVEDVRLVPSPDYISAYEARNKRMRIGAWVTTISAVVLVGTAFILDRAVTENIFASEFTPRQKALVVQGQQTAAQAGFSGEPAKTYDVCAKDLSACHERAKGAQASVQTWQAVSIAMALAGVGVGALSAYFWIAGEDPGRYSRVSLNVAPLRDGGAFSLSGTF